MRAEARRPGLDPREAPTLPTFTPDNAAETADAIPGAVLTLVDRAGHMLPQEQPAAAQAALAALLDRVTAPS